MGTAKGTRKKVDANCADNRRISKGHWRFFVQPVMTGAWARLDEDLKTERLQRYDGWMREHLWEGL